MDEPLPEAGTWWPKGPIENQAGEAIRAGLAAPGSARGDFNSQGWTFASKATAPDGSVLLPKAE